MPQDTWSSVKRLDDWMHFFPIELVKESMLESTYKSLSPSLCNVTYVCPRLCNVTYVYLEGSLNESKGERSDTKQEGTEQAKAGYLLQVYRGTLHSSSIDTWLIDKNNNRIRPLSMEETWTTHF